MPEPDVVSDDHPFLPPPCDDAVVVGAEAVFRAAVGEVVRAGRSEEGWGAGFRRTPVAIEQNFPMSE